MCIRDRFYRRGEDVYRENQMVANFIRAYESLEEADVMGIYGSAHTHLNALDYSGQVENMATQLAARYGERLHSKDLSHIEKEGKDCLLYTSLRQRLRHPQGPHRQRSVRRNLLFQGHLSAPQGQPRRLVRR